MKNTSTARNIFFFYLIFINFFQGNFVIVNKLFNENFLCSITFPEKYNILPSQSNYNILMVPF